MQDEISGIVIKGQKYRELRCAYCRKLVCFEYIFAGRVVFDCPRCGKSSIFNFKHLPTRDAKATIENEFTIGKSQTNGGE